MADTSLVTHRNLKTETRRIFLITSEDDPCRVSMARQDEKDREKKTTPKKKSGHVDRFQKPLITDLGKTKDKVYVRAS